MDTLPQIVKDYAATFNSEHGQRVLADIMTICHILEGVSTSDPNENLVQAGRRDVAVSILQRMMLRAADYPRIVASTIPVEDIE